MGFTHSAIEINANKKAVHLLPFMKHGQSVLDFGCGDMSLSKVLHHRDPTLAITGIDVVDFGMKDKNIHFQKYNGKKIPYENKQFDIVISYHVLHHTDNPIRLLHECMRVCKRTLLLVEPVYRFRGEIIPMSAMDWIFNVWKEKSIAMAYAFKSRKQWIHAIKTQKWEVKKIEDVELLPRWFPTGRSYLFVCTKR